MAGFNTHGGYFAPKDYYRINAGGSHEENPNGGVQVGMDEQGVPNMLEEGEPVYKDYVFSDNIKADKDILKKHNIPIRYAGKLYSEIADDLVEEAEERPNDPISNNGLDAMLGRLADAQEEQKQEQEKKEIEEELSNMSPEELAELEAMLSQQEQPEVASQSVPVEPQQMPVEQVPVEQPMQMPMACGGLLRRFDDGGDIPPGDVPQYAVRDNTMTQFTGDTGLVATEPVGVDVRRSLENQSMIPVLGIGPSAMLASDYIDEGKYGNAAWEAAMAIPVGGPLLRGAGRILGPAVRVAGRAIGKAVTKAPKALWKSVLEMPGRGVMLKEAGESIGDAYRVAKAAGDEADNIAKELKVAKAAQKASPNDPAIAQKVADLEAKSRMADATANKASAKLTGNVLANTGKSATALTVGPLYNKAALEAEVDAAKKALDTAKAALKEHPKTKALKDAVTQAEDNLRKAESAWNKFKHVEWAKAATLSGGAGYLGYKYADRKEDDWATDFLDAFDTYETTAPSDSTSVSNGYAYGGRVNVYRGDKTPSGQMRRASGTQFYKVPSVEPEPEPIVFPWERTVYPQVDVSRYIETPNPDADMVDESHPIYNAWDDFINQLNNYKVSRVRGGIPGKYQIDRRFPLSGYKTIKELEDSEKYKAFTNYIINHADDPNVLRYLRALDAGTHKDVEKLFDGDTLKKNWKDIYNSRRNDQLGGIYHFSGSGDNVFVPASEAAAARKELNLPGIGALKDINNNIKDNYGLTPGKSAPVGIENKTGGIFTNPPEASDEADYEGYTGPFFPTFPRYAGALGAGALALHNIATPPDRYNIPRIPAYTPEGHINLQNERYMPIDQNMIQNQMLAQGNSTQRALRNSGLGPSTGAAILASDNNTTGNLGQGLLQAWQANNQQRNAVIAANNQAEAQRAKFDFTVDATRKRAMNDAAIRNAQNDFLTQRLNYAADSDRYNAIAQQIDNGLAALSDIGRENFIMNQINSNTALGGYHTGQSGAGYYNPFMTELKTLLEKYNKNV